jgi:hypothetical protein
MYRDLEREARSRRATLEEILNPAYTVALPSSNLAGTAGHSQVPDGPVIDVETPVETAVETPVESPVQSPVQTPVQTPVPTPVQTPIEHTSNRSAYAASEETESEEGGSDTEPLSPRSNDSIVSMSSSQISDWDEVIASILNDSDPDSPRSIDSTISSPSSQIIQWNETVASILEDSEPDSPRSIDSTASSPSSEKLRWRETVAALLGESEPPGFPGSIDSGSSTSSSEISKWDGLVASPPEDREPKTPNPHAATCEDAPDEGENESESADLQHGQGTSSRAAEVNEAPSTPIMATTLAAAPVAPTSTHLAAVATLSPDELINLINEFLQQNADRLDAFRTRETVENPVWQTRRELQFLTDAVLWLDALLSPFRTGIVNEDLRVLHPRLDEASRDLDIAMRAHTGRRAGKEIEGTEMRVPRELYDRIIEIQRSNFARNVLLGRTVFDTELFGNLLSAAESVRFRIESDGGTSSWAALVEGMRRIYSTIVCTVPFGWTEVGECSFRRVPVRDGMLSFDRSLLPTPTGAISPVPASPLETGGRNSITQGSEALNPLSKEFWRNIGKGALPDVGPPQQSQADIVMSSPSPERSPHPSDSSVSDVSDKLFPQSPVVPVRPSIGRFCLLVNTPAGCQDRENCGYDSHVNEGKVCKEGEHCRRGGRCAFVHGSPTTTDPASRRSSTTQVDARTRDLRPILEQVLQNPEQYKACGFVNKEKGCKTEKEGGQCRFNHTLRDIVCPEYGQQGYCPREFKCPLMHVDEFIPTVGQPDQTGPQRDQQAHALSRPNRRLSREHQILRDLGLTIPTQPPAPVQRQGPTPPANGPPPNAPRGPRQQGRQSAPRFGGGAEGSNGDGLWIRGSNGDGPEIRVHGKRKRKETVGDGPGWDADDERGELMEGVEQWGRKRR